MPRQTSRPFVTMPSLNDHVGLPTVPKHGSLADKVSLGGRWRTARKLGREAEDAVARLELDRVRGLAEIHSTQLAVTKAAVLGALVVEGVNRVGTLSSDLVTRAAAVRMSLTGANAAEMLEHLQVRSETAKEVHARVSRNEMTAEEAEGIFGRIDADLVQDIDAGRALVDQAKAVTESLAESGLIALQRAADGLKDR